MKRYEVIKRLVGVHQDTGHRISPYGAIPPGYKIVVDGWTIRDNHLNTIGMYALSRIDIRDQSAVIALCERMNARYESYANNEVIANES